MHRMPSATQHDSLSWPRQLLSLALLGCAALLGCGQLPAAEIHVAPDGDDTAVGTAAAPLRTLIAARDRARALPAGERIVLLHPGTYVLEAGLKLDERDGGTAQASAQWRSADPDHPATITGALPLAADVWLAETDPAVLARLPTAARGQVLVTTLAPGLVAPLAAMGFGRVMLEAGPSELLAQGVPLGLARWPDSGFASYSAISNVPAGATPATATVTGWITTKESAERQLAWASEPDAWVHGYFRFDWADDMLRITGAQDDRLLLGPASRFGLGPDNGQSCASTHPYAIVNALSELDQPGEYHLDAARNQIRLIPTATGLEGLALNRLTTALVNLESTKYFTLEHVRLIGGRADGVDVSGGRDVTIERCTIQGQGRHGIVVDGRPEPAGQSADAEGDDTHILIKSCLIRDCGAIGVQMNGGNRRTLTPGGNRIDGCEIATCARLWRMYSPAIKLSGVGNVIADTWMHDLPHSAIIFGGNDHRISGNRIERCVTEATDASAIYTGRDPSQTGTVISNNLFRDLGGIDGGHGVAAIYLDDGTCGIHIINNVVVRSPIAWFIHGGQHNIASGNLVADVPRPLKLLPWTSERWALWLKDKAYGGSHDIVKKLSITVNVKTEPFLTRYPWLATLDTTPYDPATNLVQDEFTGAAASLLREDAHGVTVLAPQDHLPAQFRAPSGPVGAP